MDRALVTLGVTERSRELLVEAAERASAADAELVVLSMLSKEEADHDLEVLDRIGDVERMDHGDSTAELAEDLGERVAEEVLGDYDVEYEVLGASLGGEDPTMRAVEIAEREGCDHVYLLARRRGGLRGLFRRDSVSEALDEFPGFLTVARERDPEKRFAELTDEDEVEGDWVEFYPTRL